MKTLYDKISLDCNRNILHHYSTSFSLGTRLFSSDIRKAIAAIYGFVRLADEIVDTFHGFPQAELLAEFIRDTELSIQRGISTNPVLHSFQDVVHRYDIDHEHVRCFLRSMEMDLSLVDYDQSTYEAYILGSAEVVGLMCLRVFVSGDQIMYEKLKPAAMKLGSAFQKVNFLRDIRQDNLTLGRQYFPNLGEGERITAEVKLSIEKEIAEEFEDALRGIKLLPKGSRLGVYVAYIYYRNLLSKIERMKSDEVMEKRIRVPNAQKFGLLLWSFVKYRLHLI